MPKPMYVWSGSAWVSVASEVESLAGFATQSYADNTPGMKLIVPSSVAVGSGSGSVSTQGTVTFSGASSVSLNNAFNATYNNYKIFVNISSASTTDTFRLRLRASGTDNSSSNYVISGVVRYADNGTAAQGNTGTTSFQLGRFHTTGGWAECSIIDPFQTLETKYYSTGTRRPATTPEAEWSGGNTTVTTSYDGFTVLASSGNITGSVSIYGYKVG
jgi:hypothetical protein